MHPDSLSLTFKNALEPPKFPFLTLDSLSSCPIPTNMATSYKDIVGSLTVVTMVDIVPSSFHIKTERGSLTQFQVPPELVAEAEKWMLQIKAHSEDGTEPWLLKCEMAVHDGFFITWTRQVSSIEGPSLSLIYNTSLPDLAMLMGLRSECKQYQVSFIYAQL